jgi:hypothetical protein
MRAAWLVFLVYLVAARIPANFFPLSVFDMYSHAASPTAGRYLFLDEHDAPVRLSAIEALACVPERLDLAAAVPGCGDDFRPIPYVVRDQQLAFDARLRAFEGGELVRVVGRTHWLAGGPNGAPWTDCEVARCRMRRR